MSHYREIPADAEWVKIGLAAPARRALISAKIYNVSAGVDYISVPKSDGSVQTATVINSDESSDRLHFKLLIPAGATVSIIDTGEARSPNGN